MTTRPGPLDLVPARGRGGCTGPAESCIPSFAPRFWMLRSAEETVMGLSGLQVCAGSGVGVRAQAGPGQAVLGEMCRPGWPQVAGSLSESSDCKSPKMRPLAEGWLVRCGLRWMQVRGGGRAGVRAHRPAPPLLMLLPPGRGPTVLSFLLPSPRGLRRGGAWTEGHVSPEEAHPGPWQV